MGIVIVRMTNGQVRDLPTDDAVVLIDENVYSLFTAVADLAKPTGTRLVAIYPRTGRRAQFLARREGNAGGAARISLTGEISGTLTTGEGGRITRMEFPSAGIVVSVAE